MKANVNIISSSLNGSPVVIGNENKVSCASDTDLNWEMLEEELVNVIGKLPRASREYEVSKKAFVYVINKNKVGFRKVVKSNSSLFLSDVFKGVASGILMEIIKSILV